MHIGMGLQVIALLMLTVEPNYLTITYVMLAQALSGIAKDLNKMSAKASVKLMLPANKDDKLFKLVAILTGSKNALKGAGFFIGSFLLATIGFQQALLILAISLFIVLIIAILLLPRNLGKSKIKTKFTQIFSKSQKINWLSAARFFLFGSRDIWFVVGLPVFLSSVLNWSHVEVGSFLALWIIGYGFVQTLVPKLLNNNTNLSFWTFSLAIPPVIIALALNFGLDATFSLVIGLGIFGIVFAINSAIHSYLILFYSDNDKVALNVGFYYMANAGGRLVGTVLSGFIYQTSGLIGCLWWSVGFILIAGIFSKKL
jgi:hypothetical protein